MSNLDGKKAKLTQEYIRPTQTRGKEKSRGPNDKMGICDTHPQGFAEVIT